MKACVHAGDDVEPFDVKQGLRQGRVLSTLLFNIFIASVLSYYLVQRGRGHTRRARASIGTAAENKVLVFDSRRASGYLGHAIRWRHLHCLEHRERLQKLRTFRPSMRFL